MTLINRLSRLIKSDLHGLLDLLEEPEAVVRQAIRDMEEEIDITDGEQKALIKRLNALQVKLSESRKRLSEIDKGLDVCFAEGSEETARKLVRRKIESERHVAFIAKQVLVLEQEIVEGDGLIAEQRERLDAIRQKWDLVGTVHNSETRDSCGESEAMGLAAISEEEIESTFLSERRKRRESTEVRS